MSLGPSRIRIAAAALVASLAAPAGAAAQSAQTIRFVATDVDGTEGKVLCGLYDSADDWLTTRFVMGVQANIRSDGRAVCVFRNVAPGRYAISAFHDEDDDDELDRGLFGIPSEGYCASRNATGSFGPPSWSDAVFRVRGDRALRLTARIR